MESPNNCSNFKQLAVIVVPVPRLRLPKLYPVPMLTENNTFGKVEKTKNLLPAVDSWIRS